MPLASPHNGHVDVGRRSGPLIDQWIIYDRSDWPAAKIVGEESGTRTIFDDDCFRKLNKQTPELIP